MTFTQSINQLNSFSFRLTYSDMPEFELILDFNPVVDYFKLQGDFVLSHWQAKPKFRRGYGWFSHSKRGETRYESIAWNKIELFGSPSLPLQISESQFSSVPTAVILYNNRLLDFKTHWYLYNPLKINL